MAAVQDGKMSIKLERFAGLELRLDTPKGRGVFSTTPIKSGAILDTCPVLPLSLQENTDHVTHTSLNHYTYNWPILDSEGKTQTGQAIVFGLGSMFNHHGTHQNVGWERDIQGLVVVYKALRDIEAGEELCISYGSRLWFKDTDAETLADELYANGDGIDILSNIQI